MKKSPTPKSEALARQALIEALEYRLSGRVVPLDQLVALARRLPAFSKAWLAHAIASTACQEELAFALALAESRHAAELRKLENCWSSAESDLAYAAPAGLKRALAQFGLSLNERLARLCATMCHVGSRELTAAGEQSPVRVYQLPISQSGLAAIRRRSEPLLQPAEVYAGRGSERRAAVRDNDQLILPAPTSDVLVASLERMMAAAEGRSLAMAEQLVILRYRIGQQYHWHRDYIQPSSPEVVAEIERFGQRIHTVIAYLSDDFDGGETQFRDWGQSLRLQPGQCLSFSSVRSDGALATESIHRGAPVERGEKWAATLWSRARPLWNRRGLTADQSWLT